MPINAKNIKVAIPANFNPLFCSAVISDIVAFSSPLYSPSFGSTIFSVTIVPMIVITKVDTNIKYQLSAAPTDAESENNLAPSVEIPANNASVVLKFH